MKCSAVAKKIESLDKRATPIDVARICTLLSSVISDESQLADDDFFFDVWKDVNLRLAAASDQHAAVTQELERFADSDPTKFTQDQIWVLVRAIKIQSQLLRMYVGGPEVSS